MSSNYAIMMAPDNAPRRLRGYHVLARLRDAYVLAFGPAADLEPLKEALDKRDSNTLT